MAPTYYEILRLSRDAESKQIKKAYHALARTHHPDKAKDETEKGRLEEEFALITKAYNTLKDPDLRKQYDESLGAEQARDLAAATGSATAAPRAGAPASRPSTGGPPTGPGAISGAADVERGRKEVAKRAFAQGVKLLHLQEYERASEFLRAAIKSDESEAVYHDRLALVLLRSKKSFSEAVTAAMRASELDPYKSEYKLHLAELYEAIGSKESANKVYEEVLKWDPENSIAIARLGSSYGKTKESGLMKLWKTFVGRK